MRPQLLAPADPEPRQFLCDLSLLISEARVPDVRLKGRCEGPHCPTFGQNTKANSNPEPSDPHRCDEESPICQKAKKFQEEIENLWTKGIPILIQLCLLPEGCDSVDCLSDATVLERWHLQVSMKRNADDKVLPCHFLIQGIRSYLHFSQLSSWLAAHDGKLPFSLHYRVSVPGETEWHLSQESSSTTTRNKSHSELQKHEFPVGSLGKSGTIRVFVEAHRYADTPSITCACHTAQNGSSKRSDQKSSTLEGPRLSESSVCSTETDEESVLDGFLSDTGGTLKPVDRRNKHRPTSNDPAVAAVAIREDQQGGDEIFESSSFSSSMSEDTHFSSTSVTPVKLRDNFHWTHDSQRSQSPSKSVAMATSQVFNDPAGKSQFLRPAPMRSLLDTPGATFAENPMFQTSSVDSMEELLKEKIRALQIEANNISTRWRGFKSPKLPSATESHRVVDSNIQCHSGLTGKSSSGGDVKFFIAAEDGDDSWSAAGPSHLSDSYYLGDSSFTSESGEGREPRRRTRSTKILFSSGEAYETAADLMELYPFDSPEENLDRTEDSADQMERSFASSSFDSNGPQISPPTMSVAESNISGPHCSVAGKPIALTTARSSTVLTFDSNRCGERQLSLFDGGVGVVCRQLFPSPNSHHSGLEEQKFNDIVVSRAEPSPLLRSTHSQCESFLDVDVKHPQMKPKHPIHKVMTAGGKPLKPLRETVGGRFNDRTGLPLSSSPAPLKRNQHSFDFDASLTGARAIRNVLYDHESGSSDSECGTPMCKSAPASSHLLGNFEESALNGRLKPYGSLEGFTVELGASGAFCPPHLTLPLTTLFFNLSDDNSPSPYFGHCSLASVGRKGYHVPKKGTVQVTLFNPQQTVVKMFVVRFDFSDMPPGCQTFVRQRTFYMPVKSGLQDAMKNRSWLRYLIHLRFATSRSGKLYVHTDLRMLFSRKSELEAKNLNGNGEVEDNFELRSFTEMPKNPKFSPRKLTRSS